MSKVYTIHGNVCSPTDNSHSITAIYISKDRTSKLKKFNLKFKHFAFFPSCPVKLLQCCSEFKRQCHFHSSNTGSECPNATDCFCKCEHTTWHDSCRALRFCGTFSFYSSLSQNEAYQHDSSLQLCSNAKWIQNPSEAHLGKVETVPPLHPFLHLWCVIKKLKPKSSIRGAAGTWLKKRGFDIRVLQPHFPGPCQNCITATATHDGAQDKRNVVLKMGFAEGSCWNIDQRTLLFWDPAAVSGGAGAG